MSLPDLTILGITPELLAVMKAEREHRRIRVDPTVKFRPQTAQIAAPIAKDPIAEVYRIWQSKQTELQKLAAEDLPIRAIKVRTGGRNPVYPLQNMRVDEHFFVPLNGQSVEKLQNSLSSCIRHARLRTGRTFTQKRYPRGIRVWRIS